MDTTYCDRCGLLHDPDDGECLGCGLLDQIKLAEEIIGYVMKFDLRLSCIHARIYLRKYKGIK